jgi:regulator of protease activity HflC (stomatin/prohibitin superfamily)
MSKKIIGSMSIDELKRKKREVEMSIQTTINDLCSEAGVKVTNVEIFTCEYASGDFRVVDVQVGIEVDGR